MTWNHRVFNVKEENGGEDCFEVREAYYNDKGEVIGSCEMRVIGDTVEELAWIAQQITRSLSEPVLFKPKT